MLHDLKAATLSDTHMQSDSEIHLILLSDAVTFPISQISFLDYGIT